MRKNFSGSLMTQNLTMHVVDQWHICIVSDANVSLLLKSKQNWYFNSLKLLPLYTPETYSCCYDGEGYLKMSKSLRGKLSL